MNIAGKYLPSVQMELKRSQVHFAEYNPRVIDEEEKRNLKRGIRKYGLLGGLIANKRTGFTIVQGHQRITVMDELVKSDPHTNENDYTLHFDVIDVDEKTEKEINMLLNNTNLQGRYDDEKMARLIPEVDWKSAGFTDADLSLFGVDFTIQTEQEKGIASAIDDMMSEVNAEHEAEMRQRKMEREMERAAKVAHMKDVKQQVRQQARQAAENMEAYVMLSFTDFKAKAAFMQRFGYSPYEKILKGEVFDEQIERIE